MISLRMLRERGGVTRELLASRMSTTVEELDEIESLEPSLLRVHQVVDYCAALGLTVTMTAAVDLLGGGP